MSGETQVTLWGNLVRDPELRYTSTGTAVARFTIATAESRYDKASSTWKDEPTFMTCTVFGLTAEHVAETLTRGTRTLLVGNLKQRNYEKDGEKRTAYEVQVIEVGPALRFATAKVTKAPKGNTSTRAGGNGDEWGNPAGFADEAPF